MTEPEPKNDWPRGRFRGEIRDAAGVLTDVWYFDNAATNAGLTYLAAAGFLAGSQITNWYAGLINASGYTGVSASDTMGSHSGWAEYQGYTETVRQTWTPSAGSAGVVSNASVMTFTNGGSAASIQGAFLCSSNTKGGTTGTLYSTAVEGTGRSLAAGGTFQVFYEIDLTANG